MINQQFMNGSSLLGVALSLVGIGFIVPTLWQKYIMFACFFLYIIFAIIAFFSAVSNK